MTAATNTATNTARARSRVASARPTRLLLLIPGGVCLLAGVDAALLLLGVGAPVRDASLTDIHGVLMILGFVATVVSLERAVALGKVWGFLSPLALGVGGILLLTPAPRDVGAALFLVGTVTLVAVYIPLWRRNAQTAVLVQVAGGVLAVGGTALWLAGVEVPWLLPWLVAFLVLTIGGERLELAHVALTDPRAQPYAVAISAAVVVSVVATLLWPAVGYPLLGLSLLALVAWLLKYDIAMKTIKASGLPQFSAACLLSGYAWLSVTALIWVVAGPVHAGPLYDASTHAVLLGFVISMIMAHAPIIFPAVLKRPLPYHPIMYAPAALLHISLLIRIIGGDGRGDTALLQWGGVLNIVALLAFVVIAIGSVLLAMWKARAGAGDKKAEKKVGDTGKGGKAAAAAPATPTTPAEPSAGSNKASPATTAAPPSGNDKASPAEPPPGDDEAGSATPAQAPAGAKTMTGQSLLGGAPAGPDKAGNEKAGNERAGNK